MGADGVVAAVLAVIFLATLIRSAFGFGESLVAVPLLALVIPVGVAVPLATLLSIAVAALILAQDWRQVHARSAWRLILPTLAGMPFGLLLLTEVNPTAVKVVLAAVIISFSAYSLLDRRELQLTDDRLAWAFGLVAGVLGGAYGMYGPPLVVFAALRRWTPEQFRATLQGYFLPTSTAGLCGYWAVGLWVPDVTRYFLVSLPLVLAAVVLGRLAHRRLAGGPFFRYVHLGLIAVGLLLLAQLV